MTSSIITDYLSKQRRLTVPGLGTFIRRPEGSVAFTRLLTDDESILAGTVARAQNIPSEKAREEIRKFVEAVRTVTAAGRRYPVSGLGWFYSDPQGIVRFRYDPDAQEPESGNDPPRVQTATAGGQVQNPSRQPAAAEAGARPDASAIRPSPAGRQATGQAGGTAATMQPAASDQAVRPMNIRRPERRRRVDRTIIAAIIALLIALGVLLYGYIAKPAPDLNLQDTEQVEPEGGEAAQP